ncbi:MAG TPA: ATP-binding protein [Candidatus Eisenbacteria bacterium]|nr:ATP-binding protein [Candidatus Eisenbacteria bacterium]
MTSKPSDRLQSRIESKTWWLIGLSILMILGFSVTIPLLLLSMVRAGVLQGVLPADGGFSLVVGLLGLAALFSLNLVYQQSQINAMRRRMVQDQMDLEQSKSRFAELTSLFQLGSSLHMDLPLQTILEIAVRRVASTLHAHDVDIFLLSRETKSLHCASSFGLTPRPAEPEVPYGEGPVGSCAKTRQPIRVVAGEKGAPFSEFIASRPNTGSLLILPIQAEKRCAGVIMISRSSNSEPFTNDHRDVAQLFANNLGPVIERTLAASTLRRSVDAAAAAPTAETVSAAGSFQDTFLTAAGHELKSPLTSIVAYSEVLDQNDRRMTPAMRTEFTGRVRGEAQRMMGVVDDILDLVRLDLGRYMLELHVGGVNDVVKEAVESVRPSAAARQVEIEASLDQAIPAQHIDAAKLRQSVVHLLRNAVRFSPERSRVVVAARLADGEVRIEVRDRGPAFDALEASEIYEIESASRVELKRARDGSGFGLHLAKRFVELHGGSVGAGTAEDGSAMLWIRLPWSGDLSPLVGADPFAEELTRM